ncbi:MULTISPECIES: DUF982 domain-containing protein [unclassified Rhizobium]|uniref:DUF982 domain-containing protein n=1 Tax=unclassified Rhizobium TaxID=2613769 RepID=UPI00160F029C|nr:MULTISPECIES: DUF982 domain-containing protein [unclassified Rhizobium]MBB3543757.1 hypothetical protein [Rhizobium sp. BK399]
MSTLEWVIVIVERNRSFHTVSSAEQALQLLLKNWPVTTGTTFISAMEACAGALRGAVSQGEAQAAFLAAALQAGVVFRNA